MVKEQLAQLSTSPGVLGCCLLARDGGVLINLMPEFISRDDLHAAADAVVEAMLGLETLEDGAWEMDMAFAELICVIRPVGTSILLLLCDPDGNMPMLKLSMNVAAKRIAAAPAQELNELRALAEQAAGEPTHTGEPADEDILPPEAVRAVIAAVRTQLIESTGTDALVDQILRTADLDLDAPLRPTLRVALNELLEKGISKSMNRADATRWLNQLVKQHGLAKSGS